MLLPKRLVPAIEAGEVTVAFRRWRRPSLKSGGTLRYTGGVLAIDEVAPIELSDVNDVDARAAGEDGADAVLAQLQARADGQYYRVRFRHLGEDPRVALRAEHDLDGIEVADLARRLERMDARSARGPWTHQTLRLLAARPGMVARALAAEVGVDRDVFKRDVRKLKNLGLTLSLDVGYEISPRGHAYLAHLEQT